MFSGTDGQDGPTDAAGAIVDENFMVDALGQGLDPEAFLEANDSYNLWSQFAHARDLVVTGLTGTNVMDIQLLLVKCWVWDSVRCCWIWDNVKCWIWDSVKCWIWDMSSLNLGHFEVLNPGHFEVLNLGHAWAKYAYLLVMKWWIWDAHVQIKHNCSSWSAESGTLWSAESGTLWGIKSGTCMSQGMHSCWLWSAGSGTCMSQRIHSCLLWSAESGTCMSQRGCWLWSAESGTCMSQRIHSCLLWRTTGQNSWGTDNRWL